MITLHHCYMLCDLSSTNRMYHLEFEHNRTDFVAAEGLRRAL
jgi:hypothetical protein